MEEEVINLLDEADSKIKLFKLILEGWVRVQMVDSDRKG